MYPGQWVAEYILILLDCVQMFFAGEEGGEGEETQDEDHPDRSKEHVTPLNPAGERTLETYACDGFTSIRFFT